jgi:hypothetical protein
LLWDVVRRRGPTHTRALGGAATKPAHDPTPSFSLRIRHARRQSRPPPRFPRRVSNTELRTCRS